MRCLRSATREVSLANHYTHTLPCRGRLALTARPASGTLSRSVLHLKKTDDAARRDRHGKVPALVVIATIARGGALSDSSLKGFFHRSDARLTPPAAAAGSQVVSGVFYGYGADKVAAVCGVSLETASRWKSGKATPSRASLRLFNLYRSRKVLLSPAWDGWLVNGDVLVDPEGNATSQGQLRAYYLVYQLAAELARDRPEARRRFDDILLSAG